MRNPLEASDSTLRSDTCGGLGSHLRNVGYSRHGGIVTEDSVVGESGSLPFGKCVGFQKPSRALKARKPVFHSRSIS